MKETYFDCKLIISIASYLGLCDVTVSVAKIMYLCMRQNLPGRSSKNHEKHWPGKSVTWLRFIFCIIKSKSVVC